jgi:hypothetical protein
MSRAGGITWGCLGAIIVSLVLSAAWALSVSVSIYALSTTDKHWVFEPVLAIYLGGLLLIGISAVYLPNAIGFTLGLLVYLVQFPAFQTVVAFMYPYECTFSKALWTVDYTGEQITKIDNNTAGTWTPQERISVECALNPCVCLGFGADDAVSGLCGEQGGREWYASLCHVSALILLWALRKLFILNYPDTRDAISILNCTLIYINIVDIQDFFALFLEDDVIRNFWARDMCDTDPYHCSGGGWTYGFIPHGFGLWAFMLLSFWISNLALGVTIGNHIHYLLSQPSQTPLQDGVTELRLLLQTSQTPMQDEATELPLPTQTPTDEAEEGRNASLFKCILHCLCVSAQGKAMMFLLCIDGPFLVARTLSSMRYSILSSTLSMKNLAFILAELMVLRRGLAKIVCCCCRRSCDLAESVMQRPAPTDQDAIDDLGVITRYLIPDSSDVCDEENGASQAMS